MSMHRSLPVAVLLLLALACAGPEATIESAQPGRPSDEREVASNSDAEPLTDTGSAMPAAASSLPWERLPAPTDLPTDRPLQVGFLIVDGVYNSELVAPWDIFHHTIFHTEPGMEVFAVSPDGEPVNTFEGLRIEAHYGYDDAPPIDVLVVPSAENSMGSDLEDARMIDWVRARGQSARYVISLCDGAFVLAQAGLLAERAMTTFPGDLDAFAERFPSLDLRRGPSVVHDGPAITSQGGARSYDPAMYLIDHLYGEAVARGVGRGMVIPWPPHQLDALVVRP